jgi:hypothetical protein
MPTSTTPSPAVADAVAVAAALLLLLLLLDDDDAATAAAATTLLTAAAAGTLPMASLMRALKVAIARRWKNDAQ